MIAKHTTLVFLPCLVFLGFVGLNWQTIEWYPTSLPMFIGLAFVPLIIQAVGQLIVGTVSGLTSQREQRPFCWHPFGIVIPLGFLFLGLCWPLAEALVARIPSMCHLAACEDVATSRRALHGGNANFHMTFRGWGNRRNSAITHLHFVYTGKERKAHDLNVNLPEMDGYYDEAYSVRFPVTPERVLEYVTSMDDFDPAEAEAIKNQIWKYVRQYADGVDLPPIERFDGPSDRRRMVYFVFGPKIYPFSVMIACLPLLCVSWLLARWYCRCRQGKAHAEP